MRTKKLLFILLILQLLVAINVGLSFTMNFTYNGPTGSNIPITLLLNMSAYSQAERNALAGWLTDNSKSLELCSSSQCWNITSFYVFNKTTPYPGLSTVWSNLFLPNESLPLISFVIPNAVTLTNYTLKFVQLNRQNYVISDFISVSNTTLPFPRAWMQCAPWGDSIYCFGGHTGGRPPFSNQIVRYNGTSNTVTIMSATLPTPRTVSSCVPLGDSIYCFGGDSRSQNLDEVVRYNVTSGTLGIMNAKLPSARGGMSCVPFLDSIYCFGGYDTNQILRYNVTSDTMTVLNATLPTPRYTLSCAPWGDSIYCFGGRSGSQTLNEVVRYNVTSNTVTVMSATLPTGRDRLHCAPLGDSIYCFGGWGGVYLKEIVRYNVTSNTITAMSATLPTPRDGLPCVPLGDSIYCFGGYDGSLLNQIVRYGSYFLNQNAQVSSPLQINAPVRVYVNQNTVFSCAPFGSLSSITLTLKKGAQILSSTTINNPQVGVWYNLSYLITSNEAHATLTFECTGGSLFASQNVNVLSSNPNINNVSWTSPIVLKNFTIRYNATDIDGDLVLANITVRDINRSVDICTFTSVPINSDRLCYIPAESNSSRLNLTIIAYDSYGGTNQTSYAFDVQNNPPTITSFIVTGTFKVNQLISFSATATDPDGHTISRYEYRVRSVTDNYRIARDWSTTPNYTITACADAHDLLEFCVRAFDQFNKMSSESCTNRLVENTNPSFTVTYIQNETAIDENTVIRVNNTDVDCDPVTVTVKSYILPFWQERNLLGDWYTCVSENSCIKTKYQTAKCDYLIGSLANGNQKCAALMNVTIVTIPYNATWAGQNIQIPVKYYDETFFDHSYVDWGIFYEIFATDNYNANSSIMTYHSLVGLYNGTHWNYSQNPIIFAQRNMTYVWGINLTWEFYDELGNLWNFANEPILLTLINSYKGFTATWTLNSTTTTNSKFSLKSRFSLLPHPLVYFYISPQGQCVGRVGFREFRPNLISFSGVFQVLEIPSSRCAEIISPVISYPDGSLPDCIIISKVIPNGNTILVTQYYKPEYSTTYTVPLLFGHLYKVSVCDKSKILNLGFMPATGTIKLSKEEEKLGQVVKGQTVYFEYTPSFLMENKNNTFRATVKDIANVYQYYAIEIYAPNGSLLLRETSTNGVPIEKEVETGNYKMSMRGKLKIYLFKTVPSIVNNEFVNADDVITRDYYFYRWSFSLKGVFAPLKDMFPGRYVFVLYLLLIAFLLLLYYIINSWGLPSVASFLFMLGFVAILGFSGFPASVLFILVLIVFALFVYNYSGGR